MKNRLVTKIVGGLGNQMFQYAMAYSLSHDTNSSLILDTSWFSDMGSATPREFELDIFSDDIVHSGKYENKWLYLYNKSPRVARFLNNKFSLGYNFVREPSFTYWNGINDEKGNLYLSGYWQNEKYFVHNKALIRDLFRFPSFNESHNLDFSDSISKKRNSVSLHVRRGDYISDSKTGEYHGICDIDYYQKAMSLILENFPDAHFYIFSDDPEWVRATFSNNNITTVEGNNGKLSYRDMQLMTLCRHHILANSSFSWWGAWLSEYDGITITPKIWFASSEIDSSDIYAQGWLKL